MKAILVSENFLSKIGNIFIYNNSPVLINEHDWAFYGILTHSIRFFE